jgi:hypothetical protein
MERAMSAHGIDKALNIHLLKPEFVAALQQAWCVDTCWPQCRNQYPRDGSNPAFGNCFVSTLAAWADRGFEDQIIPCTFTQPGMAGEGWHFQLGASEGTIDPTYQQFDDGVSVKQLPVSDPMHKTVARGSIFEPNEEASLRERLNLLLERMEFKAGYDVRYTADQIIDTLKQRFAYVKLTPAGPPFRL